MEKNIVAIYCSNVYINSHLSNELIVLDWIFTSLYINFYEKNFIFFKVDIFLIIMVTMPPMAKLMSDMKSARITTKNRYTKIWNFLKKRCLHFMFTSIRNT